MKLLLGLVILLALASVAATPSENQGCVHGEAVGNKFCVTAASDPLSGAPTVGSSGAVSPAGSFAVLAGTGVTCTSSTVLGDVGVFPGTAVTQTSCSISGTVHAGDAVASAAYSDFLSAYAVLAATPCGTTLTGTLAGVTLAPGVYCFDAAATLTGVLTLAGQGEWIFKIGTGGTGALTATNFSVVMNGAQPCNVSWWVAQAATLTTSSFQGTILAGAGVTVTGGSVHGDALAQAAVTLTGTTVTPCAQSAPPPPTLPPPTAPPNGPPVRPPPATPPPTLPPILPVDPTASASSASPALPTTTSPPTPDPPASPSAQSNASPSATVRPAIVIASPTPSASAAIAETPRGPFGSVGPFGLPFYVLAMLVSVLAALSLSAAFLLAAPRSME